TELTVNFDRKEPYVLGDGYGHLADAHALAARPYGPRQLRPAVFERRGPETGRDQHCGVWAAVPFDLRQRSPSLKSARRMSAFGGKAKVRTYLHVRFFSNRPFGVKRFQAIHPSNVDVAHGLVLLFGIGTRALPSWDSKTRRNNLMGGLAVSRTADPSRHANSPHPSSREGHPSTARWNASFLLSGLGLNGFHAGTA